ncbi:MAG: ankyrin repeat domain-containing protein, partial [Desulfobacterales bacterium]|nr:ankyrin repeat domain-containing protein [Desulfobacterales bacterium]
MKRVFLCFVLALSLYLVLASSALAGKLEDDLHWAVMLRDVNRVRASLDQGANVNAKDEDKSGYTALISAAMNGLTDVAKVLLDKGADVNIKDNYGGTALEYAALFGNADIVKLLLEKGANINEKYSNGKTILDEVNKLIGEDKSNKEKYEEVVRILAYTRSWHVSMLYGNPTQGEPERAVLRFLRGQHHGQRRHHAPHQ